MEEEIFVVVFQCSNECVVLVDLQKKIRAIVLSFQPEKGCDAPKIEPTEFHSLNYPYLYLSIKILVADGHEKKG